MRAKHIEKAMRDVWDSLESHLPHTHGKKRRKMEHFHQKCVKKYSKLLVTLSKLY
jgi:hypothetical protein